MTELERVYDVGEIVDDMPSWEELTSEWASGASEAILGQLRQARAAAAVRSVYGESSMEKFAYEVGSSKSTVYNYAKVWWVYGHLLEDGNSQFSKRLESGSLSMTQLLAATKAPDPVAMIEEAEEKNLSSRAIEARIKEEEEPENVEKVNYTMTCPTCNGSGEVPVE